MTSFAVFHYIFTRNISLHTHTSSIPYHPRAWSIESNLDQDESEEFEESKVAEYTKKFFGLHMWRFLIFCPKSIQE